MGVIDLEAKKAVRALTGVEAARLLLHPASIAVVGATEDRSKFGGRLYALLVERGYPGRLYPINPRRQELLGRKAYPDLASLPETPDVAYIVLPPPHAQAAMEACAARGVGGAVVIASGFAEAQGEGESYQRGLGSIARSTGPRLVGPNCLGLVNTHHHMLACATYAFDSGPTLAGRISIASHSGALMTTIISRAQDQGVGFRYMVSAGNEADLDLCDFLEVFLEDEETRVIALFIEHVRRPALFVQLARRARDMGKPIVAVKIGRSAAGVRAARSHTAAVAGDDAVVDSVLRANGITRVNSLEALVSTAHLFAMAPVPPGPRVAVLSASGGACGLLADLASEAGLPLAQFGEEARVALRELYEPHAIHNPLDLGGMRGNLPLFQPQVVRACLDAIARDPNVSGLIYGMTTQPFLADDMRALAAFASEWGRPVVVYGGIGSAGQEAHDVVREAGLPLITDAEQCVRAVAALMRRSEARAASAPMEVPSAPELPPGVGALNEVDSKRVLAAWGLPLPGEWLATSAEEAADLALRANGPVAMKVVSQDITHKTEVRGVRLGVRGPQAAHEVYQEIVSNARAARPEARIEGVLLQEMVSGVEVMVGSKYDSQFGPTVLVGLGGVFVELLKDVALRPAPVSPGEAREMLVELRGCPLLAGFRGAPQADVEALAELIASFSLLAAALGERAAEIDLNPVMVLPEGQGVRIVDALILRGGA